ncbi:MAG: hypothetical protein ACQER7_03300 [Bacteroidota bacterium]
MGQLDHKLLEKLSKERSPNSISIYIPTLKADPESKENANRINLKNKLKEAREQMKKQGIRDDEIDEYLQPIKDLTDDALFLRNLWNGLVIFLNQNTFEYYRVAMNFDNFMYMGRDFYLLPLLRPVKENKEFYILSLNMHGVKLYKSDRFNISEVEVEEFIPEQLEEAIGFDHYKDKVYQYRSAKVGDGRTFYHGHAKGKEEKKEEELKFLRYVEQGLQNVLNNEDKPLIVASVDYIFGLFKEVTNYKYLKEENISESPRDETVKGLQQKAWTLIQKELDDEKEQMIQKYIDSSNKSDIVEEIIPNILYGRVDTLFVNFREYLWGKLEAETFEVDVHSERDEDCEDLLNFAAIRALLHDGNIYLMEPEEMPQKNKLLNATYRF